MENTDVGRIPLAGPELLKLTFCVTCKDLRREVCFQVRSAGHLPCLGTALNDRRQHGSLITECFHRACWQMPWN